MIPVDKLKAAGVNVAGVIHEKFLNDFAIAHKKNNPSIYEGTTLIEDLDDLVRIDYEFASAATFDLTPISKSRFKPIWKRHLARKGGDAAILSREGITPENVAIRAPSVKFLITVYEGQDTSKIRFKVDFDWELTARAAINLKLDGTGQRAIRLEPIKVTFAKPISVIASEIHKAIVSPTIHKPNKTAPEKYSPLNNGQEEWCVRVEKLIILFLNDILSKEISNFIREWELPRAIELMDSVKLQPDYLLVSNNMLIVGAQVIDTPTGVSPLQSELDTLLRQFNERYLDEFERMDDTALEKWRPDNSPTLSWLNEKVMYYEDLLDAEAIEYSRPKKKTGPTIELLTDSVLIDLLAKKNLSVNDGWEGTVKLDRLVKGTVGWWFRVDNAKGGIVPGGFSVGADVNIGGKIQVCHFDFDPKNFGGWQCYGPCVNLRPVPNFGIEAFPTFRTKGVYLGARLTTQGIAVSFCDWPSWANKILGWATSMLTKPLFDAIRAIISLFQIRIAKYPKHFPGTGLEWKPNMTSRPVNIGDYLSFQASPKFS